MRRIVSSIFSALLVIASCTTIDCSIDNNVMCKWAYTYDVGDTITPRRFFSVSSRRVGDGNDTVLVNRMPYPTFMDVPMSYALDTDTLTLQVQDAFGFYGQDVIMIHKTNEPVFESVDCGSRFNHTILNVDFTRNFIDTIIVEKGFVSKNKSHENLRICIRSAN